MPVILPSRLYDRFKKNHINVIRITRAANSQVLLKIHDILHLHAKIELICVIGDYPLIPY